MLAGAPLSKVREVAAWFDRLTTNGGLSSPFGLSMSKARRAVNRPRFHNTLGRLDIGERS